MGKFVLVSTREVMPSQDFLKEKTINHIIRCYFQKKEEDLPPPPIVRYNSATRKYIAIDGHNLLAVNDLLHKKTKVYVADSPHDSIPPMEKNMRPEALAERNKDLKEKYHSCILETEKISQKGLNNFETLRKTTGFLSTISEVKKKFKIDQ